MEKSGFEVIWSIRSAIENEVDELIHHPCNFEELIYPIDKDELYENDGHLYVSDVEDAAFMAALSAYHNVERLLHQLASEALFEND